MDTNSLERSVSFYTPMKVSPPEMNSTNSVAESKKQEKATLFEADFTETISNIPARIKTPPTATVTAGQVLQNLGAETKQVMQNVTSFLKKTFNTVAQFLNQKLPSFAPLRDKYTSLSEHATQLVNRDKKADVEELEVASKRLTKAVKKLNEYISSPELFSSEKKEELQLLQKELRVSLNQINGQITVQLANQGKAENRKIVDNQNRSLGETPLQAAEREKIVASNPALSQTTGQLLDDKESFAAKIANANLPPLTDDSPFEDHELLDLQKPVNLFADKDSLAVTIANANLSELDEDVFDPPNFLKDSPSAIGQKLNGSIVENLTNPENAAIWVAAFYTRF